MIPQLRLDIQNSENITFTACWNGQRRNKYLVLGRDRSYFVKIEYSDSTKMFSETDIINMLDFLIDNICVMFGGCVFQQIVDIPMGPNCSSSRRLVPLFVWGRLHTGASQEKRKEAALILLFHVPLYRWCPFTKQF